MAELPLQINGECNSNNSITEQLATHVPDMVVHRSPEAPIPQTINSYGVVMFADISGFTALCEKYCSNSSSKKKGTDQLTSSLNSYLSQIVQAILEDGGDILKFAGDALLAYWPCSRFEARAMLQYVLQESLTMQNHFDNFETPDGVILRMKLGLSVGKTHIHYIGNQEYKTFDVTGPAVDDVNIAQSYTKPGAVVISRDAWEMCDQERCIAQTVGQGYVQISKVSLVKTSDETPTLMTLLSNHQRRPTLSATIRNAALSHRRSSSVSPTTSDIWQERPTTRKKSAPVKPQGLLLRKEIKNLLPDLSEEAQLNLRTFILKTVVQKVDHGYDITWLSELRQVSVLFINLDPDTSLSSDILTRGNREQELLQTAFQAVYPPLVKYDGSLNKVFMFDKGCTFLCIFGLPYASHEDDPNRALRASIAIFNKLKGMKLNHYSIGVTTGIAFCGVVGHHERHEYTVIGQKVNMAARLMMKFPNVVTCDESTRAKASMSPDRFTMTPPVQLKGISNPEDIYFVSTESNDHILVTNDDIHEPTDAESLIGREKEMGMFLAELQHMIEHTHRDPGVIILSGTGGIGKTKLLRAMKAKAAEMDFRVVSGIGGLIEQNTPFFTVKTLLTRLLELDTCSNIHDKEQLILSHVTDEEMRKYLPLLNDLLVLKFPQTPQTLHMCHAERTKTLHKLLFSIVHQEALSQFCVFGVDNAQWMDHDSWSFILDLALDPNVVLILAVRPMKDFGDNPAIHKIWNHSNTMIIEMEGLKCEEMVQLTCQMLNVDEIPEQIVEIIRTRSHGIPLWCEELVETMLEMKVLEVIEHNEIIEERFEEDKEIFEEDDMADSNNDVQLPVHSAVSLAHGRKAVLTTIKRRKSYVGRDIGIDDIPIPDSVAGMVLTRIDNMSPSEQMVLKCAAIIGTTFHRDMLGAIIPNCNPEVFHQCLNTLAEHGIIECSVAATVKSQKPDMHSRSFHHGLALPVDPHLQCPCLESLHHHSHLLHSSHKHTHMAVDDCGMLQFVHTYVQETVSDLWTESQCQSLHESAGLYLESQAHKCMNCGGGGFAIKSNSKGKQKSSGSGPSGRAFMGASNIRHKLRRASAITPGGVRRGSRFSSISENTGGSLPDLRQAWLSEGQSVTTSDSNRRSSSSTARGNIRFDSICPPEDIGIDLQDCHCDEVLTHVYPQLVYHWRAAGNMYKTLLYLIEAAVASLATFNNMEALSHLVEARQILRDHGINLFGKLELAKLESLFGQAYFQSGEVDDCIPYFQRALRTLETHLPTSTVGVFFNLVRHGIKQSLHVRFPRRYLGCKRGQDSEKFLDQSRCMAHVVHAYHLQHKNMHTLMAALQQLNAAEEAQEDVHELVEAYATMIECCQLFNFKRSAEMYLEKSLVLCSTVQFGVEDLSTYAHLLNVALNLKLCTGKLTEALEIGSAVTRITSRFHDVPMKLAALPLLFYANLNRLRVEQCKENIKQLGELSDESDDLRAQAIMDCCQFDALLDIGLNTDEGNKLASAAETCCEEDVYHFDNTERFFLVSCLALWHSRKANNITANKFIQVSKSLLPCKYETYFIVRGLTKFLECLLILYRESPTDREIKNQLKNVLKMFKSLLIRFPIFSSRYLHLNAYYHYIRGKKSKAKDLLKRGLAEGDSLSCTQDYQWAQLSMNVWFKEEDSKLVHNTNEVLLFLLQ